MAANKAALKSIKTAIDANDFTSAHGQAAELIKRDPDNHTAHLFLGFALDKTNDANGAEKAYLAAIALRPGDTQALKGLITLSEKHGQALLDRYHIAVIDLAQIYVSLDDRFQCQSVVDKYQSFARKHGSRLQYRNALDLLLPSSNLYSFLEGRFPHPSHTFSRLISSMELEEKEWTNAQIGERRTRLGAKVDQVVLNVKREAFENYPLEQLYQGMIDWTNEDEVRRSCEEKLLQRAYDNLLVLPQSEKPRKRDQVLEYANGMVIIKHPYDFAWMIALEWVDAELLTEWDVGIFRDFVDFFPDNGLAKVLHGWLDSDASPFPKDLRNTPSNERDKQAESLLSEADGLILMVEGLDGSPNSLLAHRIMANVYLDLDEQRSSVDIARKAQVLCTKAMQECGALLQNSLDSVSITLAKALISYQSPRHHLEAMRLLEEIVIRKPAATEPLSGIGLILEEEEDFEQAASFLERALERNLEDLKIKAELAWCRARSKATMTTGLAELEDTLELINEHKPVNLSMKAETLYRIGYCQWHSNHELYPRTPRNGPYRYFIDSVKANPNFAPAYTMLGIYFEEYGRSRRRARTAFQKAFELSAGEIEAAYRLSRIFADNEEWELVELVANRVAESGKATPAPGSKKKAHNWPFAALGVVEINKQHYSRSIVHLQKALRIAPRDYHSWVSLGESYHSSGRHIAAERAFRQAELVQGSLSEEQTWFAKYMLANVRRATGAYDQAIKGYETVLGLTRADEGVALALLQTYTESAWADLEGGRLCEASRRAISALNIASSIAESDTDTFNLWKAIADACSVLASVPTYSETADLDLLATLLERKGSAIEVDELGEIDEIQLSDLRSVCGNSAGVRLSTAERFLMSGILACKNALLAASQDVYARAVSWYNLGWMEHKLATIQDSGASEPDSKRAKYSKAASKCFKQAIELEAGNAEYWNAFAVSTMHVYPALSQHAFVRSLHLNDKSAQVWTNLGAFYMLHNDHQLANDAFTRGQSADPDYAWAWLGQGLLATLIGEGNEASGLFTHAFEIAGSSSILVKQLYARSSFDQLQKTSKTAPDVASLVQPLFALNQLNLQVPLDVACNHLTAVFAEQLGNFEGSERKLQGVCSSTEEEYEGSESVEALSHFLQAKSDLARTQLAQHDYRGAVDNAKLVLDLTCQDDSASLAPRSLQRWRLSAHLTCGLAYHFLGEKSEAIEMFGKALDETDREPDVVCMLAKVLWSEGGSDERTVVQEQLLNCVERHPEHVDAVTLLGVIALVDDDQDTLEAVQGDLQAMRMLHKLNVHKKTRIVKVLAAVSAARASDSDTAEEAAIQEARREVMLSPGQPGGWAELAMASQTRYAAEMAVINSARNVPPLGDVAAKELSSAYAQTGKRSDAMRGIMVAPWNVNCWDSLADSLSMQCGSRVMTESKCEGPDDTR